jgi:hypothetical protein
VVPASRFFHSWLAAAAICWEQIAMGRCHICLRAAAAEAAEILPTLTHGRARPRSIPFNSYARTLPTAGAAASVAALCDRCRARMAAGESRLVQRALRPALFGWDVRPAIRYGSWLPRLLAALAARALPPATATRLDPAIAPDVRDASNTWRAYACGERATVGRFLLYLLPVVPLVDEWRQVAYAQRAGAMQPVIARTGDVFVWLKLPGVVALGAIRAPVLTGQPLDEHAGTWTSRSVPVPGLVRFLMFEELQRSLSRGHEAQAASPVALETWPRPLGGAVQCEMRWLRRVVRRSSHAGQ